MGIVACRTAFFVRQPRYGRYGEAGFPAGEKEFKPLNVRWVT